jgi:hypothetical protein
MWPISWLDHVRGARRGRTGRPKRTAVHPRRTTTLPLLELLEDRTVPSFLPSVNYPVGHSPEAIVAGDFTDNGVLDLAIANFNDNTVSVLLGNVNPTTGKGDGTFQAAKNYATGVGPASLAVGDFDGRHYANGKPILGLVTANSGGDLSLLLGNGNGDGTFGSAESIGLPTAGGLAQTPLSVAVGDLNKDGKLDLVVTGQTSYTSYYSGYYGTYSTTVNKGYVNVLLGNGSGGFTAGTPQPLNTSDPTSVQVADLGNGNPDVVTANPDLGSVGVLLGNGAGALGAETDYAVGAGPVSVAVGDINGDGKPDLVTANASEASVSVLLGNGNGTFQAAKTSPVGASINSLALADLNNDGKMDVVTADSASGQVSALLSKGDGTLSLPITATVGAGPIAVAAGDFNGDGLPDLAVANPAAGNVSVLLNDGTWPPPNAPALSINNVSVTEGETGTTNAVFTVSLSAASTQTITVQYATVDGTATVADNDYFATSDKLIFAPGQTTANIDVPVVGDRIAEPNETFTVTLSQPTNAFLSLGGSTGVATIVDNAPRISINSVTQQEAGHGSTAFVFTVSLSVAYDTPVTVNYATGDGSATVADGDYHSTSGTLTFAPGQTTATITVFVLKDPTTTSSEYFYVNLSNPSLDALIADPTGIGTILNNTHQGGKHH